MRALFVEAGQEVIEARLLLQGIGRGGLGGFLLEREVHPLVACPYRKLDRHGTSVPRHAVGVLNAGPETPNAGDGFLERGAIRV